MQNTERRAQNTVHSTVNCMLCTLYAVHRTLYTVRCTQYTVRPKELENSHCEIPPKITHSVGIQCMWVLYVLCTHIYLAYLLATTYPIIAFYKQNLYSLDQRNVVINTSIHTHTPTPWLWLPHKFPDGVITWAWLYVNYTITDYTVQWLFWKRIVKVPCFDHIM